MTILSNIIAPTNILSETNTATVSNKTISGSSNTLSNLDAANLASGTVPTARLGSGTADATTFLRGDNTWAAAGGGGSWDELVTNSSTTTFLDADLDFANYSEYRITGIATASTPIIYVYRTNTNNIVLNVGYHTIRYATNHSGYTSDSSGVALANGHVATGGVIEAYIRNAKDDSMLNCMTTRSKLIIQASQLSSRVIAGTNAGQQFTYATNYDFNASYALYKFVLSAFSDVNIWGRPYA